MKDTTETNRPDTCATRRGSSVGAVPPALRALRALLAAVGAGTVLAAGAIAEELPVVRSAGGWKPAEGRGEARMSRKSRTPPPQGGGTDRSAKADPRPNERPGIRIRSSRSTAWPRESNTYSAGGGHGYATRSAWLKPLESW